MRLDGDFQFNNKSIYCDVYTELLALAAYYMKKRGVKFVSNNLENLCLVILKLKILNKEE